MSHESKRGFGSMSEEKRKAIARKGGKATQSRRSHGAGRSKSNYAEPPRDGKHAAH